MAIPRFFKLPKHRRFDYQPLYYDPAKEEREKRNREIARDVGIKPGDNSYTPGIRRGSMKGYFKGNAKSTRQSNIRLVLIIIFLLFVSWMIFYR